jgi:hypothetical protein
MSTKIGAQHGATAAANRWRNLDPGGTKLVKGADGKWPPLNSLTTPQDQWGAYDKLERALTIAFADHDAAIGGNPPPDQYPDQPPADGSLAAMAKNVIFCAQDPAAALSSPGKFKVALTADPAYASWVSQSLVDQFHAQGRLVFSWGVQTQIPPSAITDMRDRYGMDGAIGQGETEEEYVTAMEAGFGIIVANPNAWSQPSRDDANARIAAGTLAVIGEDYANLGGPPPNEYGAGGVNICSVCIGVYDGSNEQPQTGWNPSVAWYKENCSPGMWADIGVYHAAGVDPAEWGLFA